MKTQSELLRDTIVGSRRKQESRREIDLRPRVIQDKTRYSRKNKHRGDYED